MSHSHHGWRVVEHCHAHSSQRRKRPSSCAVGGASRPVLTLSGGALLVAYGSNTLSALNPQDGATLWRVTIPGGLAGVTTIV